MHRAAAGVLFLLTAAFPAAAQIAPLGGGTPPESEQPSGTVSPLPPPTTRSGLRGRWFEFLSALNEDDFAGARLASADLLHTASRVGIARLSDFSRGALYEARLADRQGKVLRADLALETAIRLDPDLIGPRWE